LSWFLEGAGGERLLPSGASASAASKGRNLKECYKIAPNNNPTVELNLAVEKAFPKK